MNFVVTYWAQIAVLLGLAGYILKTIFDYRIKNKELRNKYFYELKAAKIVQLYSKIVEIQITIYRHIGGEQFEGNICKKRIELDTFFWESQFYFGNKTQRAFQLFLGNLKFFETPQIMQENPEIEMLFEKSVKILLRELKKELI